MPSPTYKPPPEPWTPAELCGHLAKQCGIPFEVGEVLPDPKSKGYKFWVLMPISAEIGVKMAIVRVSPKLEVTVDMSAQDAASRKVITILRENLAALSKPMTRG